MSLISSVTSIFSGGMTTVYKYLAIGGLALSLAVGGYFYGSHVASAAGKLAIAKIQAADNAKITDLLGIQTITNDKIVTQVVTKTVHIHDQTKQIEQNILKLPDTEHLSFGWVRDYNASINYQVPSTASSTDDATSSVTADSALSTIVQNNGTCEATTEQLSALQAWIKQTQSNVVEANKTKK